jgi:purine-cytosine permease-like protein
MSSILTFLGNLRLTVEQWLLLCLSAAMGALVVAFELQGSKLHKTQVELLRAQFGNAMSLQDSKVGSAKQAFEDALEAYIKAQND